MSGNHYRTEGRGTGPRGQTDFPQLYLQSAVRMTVNVQRHKRPSFQGFSAIPLGRRADLLSQVPSSTPGWTVVQFLKFSSKQRTAQGPCQGSNIITNTPAVKAHSRLFDLKVDIVSHTLLSYLCLSGSIFKVCMPSGITGPIIS